MIAGPAIIGIIAGQEMAEEWLVTYAKDLPTPGPKMATAASGAPPLLRLISRVKSQPFRTVFLLCVPKRPLSSQSPIRVMYRFLSEPGTDLQSPRRTNS